MALQGGPCRASVQESLYYLGPHHPGFKVAVNTVRILSKSCMFFWVLRFAKITNFLLKGGIHFFSMIYSGCNFVLAKCLDWWNSGQNIFGTNSSPKQRRAPVILQTSLSTSTVSLIHPPTEPLHSTNDEYLRDVGR